MDAVDILNGFKKGLTFDGDAKDTTLEDTVKYLQIAITNNPEDYGIVAYSALSLFYMSQMKYYKKNPTLIGTIKQKEKEYAQCLEKNCKQSEIAREALKLYRDNVNSFLSTFHKAYRSKLDDVQGFLQFLEQRPIARRDYCPYCYKPDIFWGLRENCLECEKPLLKKTNTQLLQFALEILSVFIENFDEANPEKIRLTVLSFFDRLIKICEGEQKLPNDKEIDALKDIVKSITIGGNRVGGQVSINEGKPDIALLEDIAKRPTDLLLYGKAFGVLTWAMGFILNL